jgi:SHAQKYF class myb-like DNA-binding protein
MYGAMPGVPPYAAPPPPRPPVHNAHHNSNFWLQEEEERFLLGLRLYGWGQWKRIQTVVQTRSNKQIKSHAQKREKVNPDIKFKYAKGKSRRGRMSAKLGEPTSPYGAPQPESSLALDDPSLPPMEELWKDVYGTNNGVGPNSRLRRYRSNALHQKWLEEVAEKPESETTVATEKTQKAETGPTKEPAKKKISPEGQYLQEHRVLERQQHHYAAQPSPGPPMPYYPPPHPYAPHPGYAMPPPTPGRMHAPGPYPPPYHHPPIIHQPSTAHHAPHHTPTPHPPIVHQPNTPAAASPATAATTPGTNEEALRPGMRVYAKNKNATWTSGVIYSAKVDPNKPMDANQSTVPLVYHVQFDRGEEDPEIQEEYILSKSRYENAIEELESHYNLMLGQGKSNTPLDAGVPVYAQWMDRSNPTSHARWLPGTIGSIRDEETPNGTVKRYHILFDNASEKEDVAAECVLDRNEYHDLVKHKHHYQSEDPSKTPISEIYNLFSRGGDPNAGGIGQGMDLLFTASQMAAPMDTLAKKRAEPDTNDEEVDPATKKLKMEEVEQQQEEFALI